MSVHEDQGQPYKCREGNVQLSLLDGIINLLRRYISFQTKL